MARIILIEQLILLGLVGLLGYLLWQERREQLEKVWEELEAAARQPRQWKAKTPKDCPACQSGLQVKVQRIQREVKPWRECKSSRGRRKRVRTEEQACPNPECRYHGMTDEAVHALCRRHCYAMFGEAGEGERHPDPEVPVLPGEL